MTSEADRWPRVRQVFQATIERPEADRARFLREASTGDSDLQREVESLLDAHVAAAEHFMESPAIEGLDPSAVHVVDAAREASGRSVPGRRSAMPRIATGTQIGAYKILGPLGEGGMSVVYRARDERLGRDVAMKVLPEVWLTDPIRRARLEREARVLAAFNHPHIGAIYGIEDGLGVPALVLELVEGATLAERIAIGALSLEEALGIAEQIAEALEAAHQRGIIHRDLKPANVKIRPDGAVKVLDFGLAKAVGADADADVAAAGGTASGSREGLIVGTPAYMSPEQARGEAVDARTDIWAFGCVLYEMLTGKHAFAGSEVTETLAAVIDGEIDWQRLAGDTPAAVQRLLNQCLARARADRLSDITIARREIQSAISSRRETDAPDKRRGVRIGQAWPVGVALLLTLAIVAPIVGRYRAGRSSTSLPPLVLENARQLTSEDRLEIQPSISRDNRFVAYSGGTAVQMRIFIRTVTGSTVARSSNDSGVLEFQPRWSPDGSQILYVTPDGAFVMPSSGGTRRRLGATLPEGNTLSASSITTATSKAIRGAAWSPDGKHVALAANDGLFDVTVETDESTRLATSQHELHSCDWSANSKWIACASGNWTYAAAGGNYGNLAPTAIVLVAGAGGEIREITDRTAMNLSPVWSPSSHRLYFVSNRQGTSDAYAQGTSGDVYAVEITADGQVQGKPARVTTGLGASSIALSGDGKHLVYAASFSRANIWSLPIPPAGPVSTAGARPVTSGTQIIEAMKVSPNGRWLEYDSNLHGKADIYRVPTAGGGPERLTTDAADNFAPDLTADGKWLVYHSWRTGSRDIFVQQIDNGRVEQVTASPSQESFPSWSPDGRMILFFDQTIKNGLALGTFLVRRDASGRWGTPVALPIGVGGRGSWSPDGHSWVYSRWEPTAPTKGTIERFTFGSGVRRVLYAPRAPDDPLAELVLLSEDGRKLYFKSHDPRGRASIWSMPVEGGRPSLLVQFEDLARPSSRWDFAAGAGRFFFAIEDRQSDIWIADVTEH
jgi:eukaryotic-like serine/threonine-protein kinase